MFFSYQLFDEKSELLFDLYYGSTAKPDYQVMHQLITGNSGHIDFQAENDGTYAYCLSQVSANSEKKVKISITLTYGFDSEHYEKLVKTHNFDIVNLQVHKLNDLLTMTLNEADYQKHQEVEYHEDTEKMNLAALWWPVVQVRFIYYFEENVLPYTFFI